MQDHPCDKHWVFFFLCLTEGQDLRGVSTANTQHSDCCWVIFKGTFRQFQSCGKHTPSSKSQALVPLSRERGIQVNLGGKRFFYDNIQEEARNRGGDISHGRFPESGTKADYQEMVKK